jgi:sterol 3beta-glucosyltransferase
VSLWASYPLFTPTLTAMRWPRINLRRADGSQQSRTSSASSSGKSHQSDKSPTPPQDDDPGLARLFSDAASFDRILNPSPEVVEKTEDKALQDNLNGFTQLVGRDLDDHERVASEQLAQLTVSNWAPGGSANLAPDVGVDESEESTSEGEPDAILPGVTPAAGESDLEDKLTPNDVLELLQNEFGALAPAGEEKLLLEADATLFQDVVILVRPSSEMVHEFMLTSNAGGGAPHHTSHHVPCVALVVSTRPK